MKIFYTKKFEKSLKRLPGEIRILALQKIEIFRENPHDARLKTHVLMGELEGRWAFTIKYQYRIVFKFLGEGEALLLIAGTHDIYR